MEKKTIFIEMKCCKCNKSLGMGIFNETLISKSFIPAINQIECHGKTLNFYCNKCYIKEVLDIDL